MLFTVFNTLFLIAYLLSAAVQFNDPDALPWIAIYLLAALMCATQYRRKRARWLPRLLLAVSVVWIVALLPSIIGKVSPAEVFESVSMRTRTVEEAREIGGLALIALWATVSSLYKRQALQPGK